MILQREHALRSSDAQINSQDILKEIHLNRTEWCEQKTNEPKASLKRRGREQSNKKTLRRQGSMTIGKDVKNMP